MALTVPDKRTFLGATIGLIAFLLLGLVVAASPMQQSALTSDQQIFATLNTDHTQIAQLRSTVDRLALATSIAALPSPTPRTNTPSPIASWTATLDAAEPTTEVLLTTMTQTATFANVTATRTVTRTPAPLMTLAPGASTATLLPYLELDYACHVVTLDDMTRRETPGVTGVKLNTIPEGTELLIYPNDSTLMFDTNYWYVRIHEDSGSGYVFYAYTIPPEEMEPGVIPRVVEAYLQQSRPSEFCQPNFLDLRN